MSEQQWWCYDRYEPAEEGRRETLCTLSNGIFATRGAAPEAAADGVHYPGTYAAGVFNRLTSELDGGAVTHETIVNLPNWLPLTHRPAGGPWFSPDAVEVLDYRQELDLEAGALHRTVRFRDRDGRITSLRERRFVSMAAPRLAVLEQVIEPENWSGTLTLRSTIDGTVTNAGTAEDRQLANRHLTVTGQGEQTASTDKTAEGVAWLVAETVQSHVRVAVATRTTVTGQDEAPGAATPVEAPGSVGTDIDVPVAPGRPATVEKVAALCTSREPAISEPGEAVLADVNEAGSYDELFAGHRLAWAQLWGRCQLDLHINADTSTGLILDLHLFHLIQTLSPHIADRDIGVPARGLHGEAYRGHIFWDELFVFPFLNLRLPQLTQELLLYRWRRLPAARRQARDMGCRGARFPWQSGSDGSEQTPTQLYNPRSGRWMPDHSRRQHHVGLAVAWNVWQYWQVTGDARFLVHHGAELLIEIARFFADLATFDPDDQRWHLRGVMGPDEYHDGYPDDPGSGIDDNAYTNVLAAWLLGRALETYQVLKDHDCGDLWERLDLEHSETERWDELRRALAVPFLPEGYIAQFAGWDDLNELDWEAYRARYDNIGRLDLILDAEGDNTNNYKLTKQADALMLLYLFSADELVELLDMLGYDFDPALIPPMVDHYLARTADGSTLSHVAYSWVLSRGDRPRSWPLLLDALQADVADTQGGTTAEGVHFGAMAGTVSIVQRAYSGLETRGEALHLDPHLPDDLDRLHFDVTYRGHRLHVDIDHARLRVSSRPGTAAPVPLDFAGSTVHLAPGEEHEIPLTRRT